MPAKRKSLPKGTHTLTAHLIIRDAEKAVDFYQRAFGAKVNSVHKTPDGKVMHADLTIGDSHLMFADEFPAMGGKSPEALGGSPVYMNLYVPDDVDSLFQRAVDAGAKVTMPLSNQFWGDRYGQVVDPFGHHWALGAHVEDVAPEEMERRANAMFAEMGKKAAAAGSTQ